MKSVSDFEFRISFGLLALSLWLSLALAAHAQVRPYIGFVYPAGGQQGATFQIRVGGQGLDEIDSVLVTGSGVTAKVTEFYRRLGNQEMQLLNEQLAVLRRGLMSDSARDMLVQFENAPTNSENATMSSASTMMSAATASRPQPPAASSNVEALEARKDAARKLIDKIEKRTLEYVQTPACASIASLVLIEVAIAPDAEPGERELRLVTLRGVSNPLVFYVGQLPEHSRKPMVTAIQQVLGKESQSLRKRLPGEEEERITIPCTVNGQIASGEVNRYRFQARQGQRLVLTTLGRQLVPFIADAVPGWFQPVLALYDANGKEVAYGDDYQFKPDPTIFYTVPQDGEYVFAIRDSLYRGREDFVYRISVGELPFITSVSPLGGPAGKLAEPEMKGWNLAGAELLPLPREAAPGSYSLAARRKGFVSNRVPFVVDSLPEIFEREPNNTPATAQPVTLPLIINGRIDRPDDWDVFRFSGKSNDTVVVEVQARRLDSPLDSVIKLTDAAGGLLAFNDDHEDLAAGLNTHAADSYLMVKLPADGAYEVHIGDTARQGGPEYGYRLRISAPQPDFDLRMVPSSLALRAKSSGTLTVYARRKDGFAGPIKLDLKEPTAGFSVVPVTLAATQTVARITVKTSLVATREPVSLAVVGTANVGDQALVREAVPAEDKMQAFLWRHLVPAIDLKVLVFDPAYQPLPKRVAPARPLPVVVTNAPVSARIVAATNAVVAGGADPPARTNAIIGTNTVAGTNGLATTNTVAQANKPKFTRQQVAGRLRQLKLLYEEGMFTDDFYNEKVAECEAAE